MSCKSVLGLGVSKVCGLHPALSSETLGIVAWKKREGEREAMFVLTTKPVKLKMLICMLL